jgi:AcrR family transcriptional regulator
VSRTALYRHFSNKQGLLAAVADEGFRMLRAELLKAWAPRGREGFDAMGVAYVQFAIAHSSHYRVAFGGHVRGRANAGRQATRTGAADRAKPAISAAQAPGGAGGAGQDCKTEDPGRAAFQVLVDAIVEQQKQGLIRRDDPLRMALFIWSVVHGVAMLALDGMLPSLEEADRLVRFANERLRTGIAG